MQEGQILYVRGCVEIINFINVLGVKGIAFIIIMSGWVYPFTNFLGNWKCVPQNWGAQLINFYVIMTGERPLAYGSLGLAVEPLTGL
jgi:hypothetical protein